MRPPSRWERDASSPLNVMIAWSRGPIVCNGVKQDLRPRCARRAGQNAGSQADLVDHADGPH